MRAHGVTDVNSLAKDSLQISEEHFIQVKSRGNALWTKLDKSVDLITKSPLIISLNPSKTTDQEFFDLNNSLRKQAGLQ